MKNKWFYVLMALFLISSIARLAETSPLNALIATAVIAVVILTIWLYERGTIRISDRILKVLKKIGTGILAVIAFIYLVGMTGYAIYSAIGSSDWYAVIILCIAGIIVVVLWYICRWRRWWVKFLRTFMPKDAIDIRYWDIFETYYWTPDFQTNAEYSLLPENGIFRGQTRIWLSPDNIETEATERLETLKKMLTEKDIEADCTIDHISGCIYADISAEINYKKMNSTSLSAFRTTFKEFDKLNYPDDYYVEYHGVAGTIIFACCRYGIIRAIRTEPNEEYFIEPECGFQSDEAHSFIERFPDWTEGIYKLITEEEFFNRWRKRMTYYDDDEAFEAFDISARSYFAAIRSDDEKEQANSRWDIECAANWLIANRDNEAVAASMAALMECNDETSYWAARLFKDIFPEEANDAAWRIVQTCEDPEIVCRTQQLIELWEGNRT